MKKIFLIFLISLISFLSATAQRTDLIYSSEKFPEKEISKYKLKILTNGNTANIGLTESIGFFCTLYDANKKTIAHTIVPTKFEISMCIMRSVFEVNNDIIVMITSYDKNVFSLVRYVFDGYTGVLKKEGVLLSRLIVVDSEAHKRSIGLEPVDFFIQKDPNSNYYALAYYDCFTEDINKRIEVIHYSPTHEILTRAFLPNPDSKYLKSHYVDMYVNGSKSIILCSYLFNNEEKKESCFYLSELKAGTTNFKNLRAIETMYYRKGEALFIYNKVTNKVKLVSTVLGSDENGKSTGYYIISQTLNIETLALSELMNLHSEKLDAKFMITSPKNHYSGLPQNYCIDSNGNMIILSEFVAYADGFIIAQEIGVNSLTPTGGDLYGEIIHYIHSPALKNRTFMYPKVLNGQYTLGNNYDEFSETYLALISGKSSSYLFLNNTQERFEMLDNSTPTLWAPINSSKPKFTSFIYTLNDAGIVSKEYIFGKPVSDDVTKYCRFNTADYDPATGLYAVIVVDKIKGKKTVSVLWMNLK